MQDPKDRAGRKRKVNRKAMLLCVVACATKHERGAEAASAGAHLNRRRRNLSGPGSLESLLEGGDGAARLGESDAQMLEGLKQRIGTPALGRAADPGQRRSQNGQTPPEPLDQVIKRTQHQRRLPGLPGGPDRQTVEPPQDRLPHQGSGEAVSRQHPGEENRKRATATPSLAPVAAPYPLASQNASLLLFRLVAVQLAVAIQRPDPFTEKTSRGLDRAKELLQAFRIGYKDHMFRFLHRRKIEDVDELSNQANDFIRAGKWAEAERLCHRLREAFPDELDADDRMAQLYQAQQNYAQALPHAQAALDKARRDPEKFDPELVADLVQQVDFLRKKAGA